MHTDQMSRRTLLRLACAAPLLASCAGVRSQLRQRRIHAAAPFEMPGIRVPDFSSSQHFPVTEFGADEGDQRRTSAAIAQAIAAANAAGSGVVSVPQGIWPTGRVHLKSNVNLHLEKGAVLLFSDRPEDYLPAVPTTWEGIECYNYSPLVYAHGCDNVAITGEGELRAKLDHWETWYDSPPNHTEALVALYYMAARGAPLTERQMVTADARLRPQFIQFNRCRHVLVEDIRIENSPFWALHPFLCEDVVIRGVRIRAHGANTDGVDPEMSRNVLIENCVFDQGDDAVAVKSGRDHDGWRLGVPSRNIVMRNCLVKNGHQLISIGSELSAGVENVYVHDCHIDPRMSAEESRFNNILFVKTNERRGGYVHNVHVSDVSATAMGGGVMRLDTDVLFEWRHLVPTLERRLTRIRGLHVSNIVAHRARFLCEMRAEAELPVQDVSLSNIRVAEITGTAVTTQNVKGFVNRR